MNREPRTANREPKSGSPLFRTTLAALVALMLLLALTLSARGQVLTTPTQPPGAGGSSSPPASAPQPKPGRSGGGGGFLGGDVPFLDPGSETLSWDGKNWNIADNRLFSARFEKYLGAPEQDSGEDSAYRQAIDDILAALSPSNPNGPSLQAATRILPVAATYYADARICDSLANAIYGVYLSQNNVAALDQMNASLDAELDRVRRNFQYDTDVSGTSRATIRKVGDTDSKDNTSGGGKSSDKKSGESSSGEESSGEEGGASSASIVGGYIRRVTELEAMRLVNKADMATSEIQSKIEFQALIVQLFLQRRFEHAIMGCRFYRKLFSDGDNQLRFEKGSEAEKAFGTSIGFNPTISTVETLANEIIRDVDEGVESFLYHSGKGELESATKRLSEAFVVGEYLPKIRTLPRTEKEKVLQFVRDSNQLISAIDVKDYGLAEELVTRMREMARDFDYSKPLAAIETTKRISAMRIRKAKNAAMAGDSATYEENIQIATELWPTNPELKTEFDTIADQADVKNMALVELDRLITTRSYRQIFDDQGRYIAASVGDKEREKQLKDILTDIARIDTAVTQAQKLTEVGDKWGAWETVENLFSEFSEDPKLSKVRSDLATEVADFVSALKKAENLEGRDQRGSSLAWYLKARRMYPNSTFAKRGISRLVDEILPDNNPTGGGPGEDASSDGAQPDL